MTIRLRFAPAPTGYLHLGSARTALFNWLYARHTGGEMVLRIEDTNADLATPEYIDNIFRSLEWLGIDYDGQPVRQSQRTDLYAAAVDGLLAAGHAYHDEGAVRFRVPRDGGSTSWDDIIRGTVTFEHEHLEDFVIRRSDATITFFLANAVDDVDLGITHVVRGEDLLNVTPKVLLLREALGANERPAFAHLPLIVNEQRKKLSKRRDDVSLWSYRDQGFLPEAMVNYLALLGWGPPDGIEVRPVRELVELFELADVNQAPAAFDVRKLLNINAEHLRSLAPEEFRRRAQDFLGGPVEGPRWEAISPLVQERVKTLAEVWPHVDFLFGDPPPPDDKAAAVLAAATSAPLLREVIDAYRRTEWSASALHAVTAAVGERHGLKLAKAQAPVRAAVTGRTVGPPLFESLELLGRVDVLGRLEAAAR